MWLFKDVDRPPLTLRFLPSIHTSRYSYAEIYNDPTKMLINELEQNVLCHLVVKDDAVPSVRADYGVAVIPSAFGCEFTIPENGMPWITHRVLEGDRPDPDRLSEPVFDHGLPSKVLETEQFFVNKLEGTGVIVYLADTQGPFNLAHHLMGENVFLALYRFPHELREILSKATAAYIQYTKIQKKVICEPLDEGAHGWDRKDGPSGIWMSKGGVRLCDDSAAMLSPQHYEEFCSPFTLRSIEPFDGCMWHSCGKVNHLLPVVLQMKGIRALNLGNPEMHVFRDIRKKTFEKGICLVWKDVLPKDASIERFVEDFFTALNGDYTGVIFSIDVSSLHQADKLKKEWQRKFSND